MRKILHYQNILVWVFLAFVVIIFARFVSESSQNYQLRNKADDLEIQNTKLEAQIEDLANKIAYYKTDSYREILAREKLNLAAPGESVIIIKDDKRNKQQPQATPQVYYKTSQSLEGKSNPEQWRLFLFGN
jgi:cell division protein FtsL